MPQKDKWPFIPVRLSEIIDQDTLVVIESGCCERLGRPLTMFDYDPQSGGFSHRIESINERRRYEAFCRLLRDEKRVSGGDRACKREDIEQARKSLQEFYETQDPFRVFVCHMGLVDMTYIVRIGKRPVALVFSGQYRPPEGVDGIQTRVQGLGTGSRSHIKLGSAERDELLALAQDLPPVPPDARERLEREVMHIQKIAEAELERHKRQWEQAFLDELRRTFIDPGEINRDRVRERLRHALGLIRSFCHCEYVVFFGSVQEGDTVLAPIAEAGIPVGITQSLPHFNWKKARLPLEHFDAKAGDIIRWFHKAGSRGIRGDNSEYFDAVSCIVPTSLGDRYRGVLVLGPFAEPVDVQEERRFLIEIASAVGSFALTELQVLNLERERRRWRSTATLLTHQLRTALTPITALIGRSKALTRKNRDDVNARRVNDFLNTAEDMALQLSRRAKQTLEGHVVQLEREDLEFERYSLSVLVANCVEGFASEARKRHRTLVVDEKIERLPKANVDVARLTIALSNLIENAIKYSFPNTKIYVRADLRSLADPNLPAVTVEVDTLGDEIRPEVRGYIFEEGTRGLTEAKTGRISGTGLGLWETRSIVDAH
ncbi:MAG: PocR ligand-binding domain-containing protein, partial [Anaerolineae bacterium]